MNALIYDVEIARCISGSGAFAPAMWQRGQYGTVIDYALRDVQITRALFARRQALKDPTDGRILTLREPEDA
jgi:hypothetical protein